MRSIAIGLVAAVLAAALTPVAAMAADKGAPGVGDAKTHAEGMADVPPLIQQTGINCTPTDANLVGKTKQKDAASGKEVETKVYEVVCQEGLGYVVMAPDAGEAHAFDCLAFLDRKPKPGEPDKGQVYCRLPGNADPLAGMTPLLTKAGIANCMPSEGRYMGSATDGKLDEYEVACSDGSVYVLQDPRAGSPKKLTAVNCLLLKVGDCQYMPKEKYLAQLTSVAAPAARNCQATDARWIGATSDGSNFFELACTDPSAGFVLQTDPAGKYVKTIDCARASAIAGGCTLTAAAASQTADTGTYTRLAQQIGYPCNVKAYHSFGLDSKGREVVELSCSDHPGGVIATLPVDKGQSGEYWNCLRAEAHQLQCALTPKEDVYAVLTTQLSAAGKHCHVTNGRPIGTDASGDDFVEVVCQEGGGNVIDYGPGSDKVKNVLGCGMAKGIGGGCKLTAVGQ